MIPLREVTLTRVGYADVSVPAEAVGLAAGEIASIDWARPVWADGEQARAGAAVWIVEHGDVRIAVDPAQAADDILRNDQDAAVHQEAFAALVAGAGFARETITHVVASHLEGAGMMAWRNDDGSWVPFFPNAPILVTQTEIDDWDAGAQTPARPEVLAQLRAQGALQPVADAHDVTPAVRLERSGGHCPGHQIVRVHSDGRSDAVMVGHLAVTALHLATGPNTVENRDAPGAWTTLSELRDSGTILVGPLWPAPGAGRWTGERFVPVTSPR